MKHLLTAAAVAAAACSGGQTQAGDRDAALHDAARAGELAEVRTLIAAGHDPDSQDEHSATPLLYASYAVMPEIVGALLAAGADPNSSVAHAGGLLTPLYAATDICDNADAGKDSGDCYATMEALLSAGADPDVAGPALGWYPLHFAVAGLGRAFVQLLLDHGANPNVVGQLEEGGLPDVTPLRLALSEIGGSRNMDVVYLLLEAGADANLGHEHNLDMVRAGFSDAGEGLLITAAIDGDEKLARLLLDQGISPNARISFLGDSRMAGKSALHFAALYGEEEITAMLLQAFADPNVADADFVTPLRIARAKGHGTIEKLLIDWGARR